MWTSVCVCVCVCAAVREQKKHVGLVSTPPSLPPISMRMKDMLGGDEGMSPAGATSVPARTSSALESYLEESELRALRRENKQLVEELSHVSRTPRDEVFERHRVSKVKNLVVRLQLEYNNVRHQLECRRRTLSSLKSKLLETAMLTKDRGESAGIIEEGKPSVNVQLDVVMRRVQEVEESLNDSDYTNKTYEHILKRYDKERQGMENAYLQMNSTLERLSKAHDEMEINIKETKHEESSMYVQMSGMAAEMEEMRAKRERMLNITRKRVDEQAELHRYMSDRDVNRAGIAKEAQGDLDKHGESVLQDRMMQVRTKKMNSKNAREKAKKVETDIHQSIGDMDDKDGHKLMSRLENLKLTKEETEQKRQQAERRRGQKEEELALVQQQLTEVQTSGVDLSYRRAVYDDIERRMNAANRRCSIYKNRYESILGKLLPLYNGLEGLNAKLETSSAMKGKGQAGKGGSALKDSGGDDGDKRESDKSGGNKGEYAGKAGDGFFSGESSGREDSSEYNKYFENLENLDAQLTSIIDGLDSVTASDTASIHMAQSARQSVGDDVMSNNNVRVPITRGSRNVIEDTLHEDGEDDD